jgi:hypothetical protein
VIYGYGTEIEQSGNDFYAHKTGFTQKSLLNLLHFAGFKYVYAGTGNLEIFAFAFIESPGAFAASLLGLPDTPHE